MAAKSYLLNRAVAASRFIERFPRSVYRSAAKLPFIDPVCAMHGPLLFRARAPDLTAAPRKDAARRRCRERAALLCACQQEVK